MRREEARRIPVRFDYASVPGLSNEIIEKLTTARPENLAQAARISGVTPAAVTLINILLEKRRRAIPDAAPRFRRRGAPIGAPRNTGSGSLSWRRNHS